MCAEGLGQIGGDVWAAAEGGAGSAFGAGAGEEVAVLQLALADRGLVGDVDVGDEDLGIFGDVVEGSEGRRGLGVGYHGVGAA